MQKKIAFLSSEETKLDNIYLHFLINWKGHCCEMVWISVSFYIYNLIFIKRWCSVTALFSQAVIWSIAVGRRGRQIGSTDFTQQLLTELLSFDRVAKLEGYVENSTWMWNSYLSATGNLCGWMKALLLEGGDNWKHRQRLGSRWKSTSHPSTACDCSLSSCLWQFCRLLSRELVPDLGTAATCPVSYPQAARALPLNVFLPQFAAKLKVVVLHADNKIRLPAAYKTSLFAKRFKLTGGVV